METSFKIAKFVKNENLFEKTGYDEYQISYLRGTKIHELRVVVNGFLTKQSINLIDPNLRHIQFFCYQRKYLLGMRRFLPKTLQNT